VIMAFSLLGKLVRPNNGNNRDHTDSPLGSHPPLAGVNSP
jgi:hypothetical protein